MNYSLSEEAFADLDELWGYIAADSIDAADRVVASFVAAFGLLATHPLIGHGREEVTERPLLFWPVGSYTIVYRPETEPSSDRCPSWRQRFRGGPQQSRLVETYHFSDD